MCYHLWSQALWVLAEESGHITGTLSRPLQQLLLWETSARMGLTEPHGNLEDLWVYPWWSDIVPEKGTLVIEGTWMSTAVPKEAGKRRRASRSLSHSAWETSFSFPEEADCQSPQGSTRRLLQRPWCSVWSDRLADGHSTLEAVRDSKRVCSGLLTQEVCCLISKQLGIFL